jgi:hypothetical protein
LCNSQFLIKRKLGTKLKHIWCLTRLMAGMRKKGLRQRQKYYTPVWGPRLQHTKPIMKSGTGFVFLCIQWSPKHTVLVFWVVVFNSFYSRLHLVSSVPNVASFTGSSFLIDLSVFSNIYIHCSVLMYKMKY